MLTRRQILAAIPAAVSSRMMSANTQAFTLDMDAAVFKIAFGSCLSQRKEHGVLSQVLAHQPQLFVMMGDGVYPEHEDSSLSVLESIESAYRHQAARVELKEFRERVPTIAIWDDNDYGGSDIGARFEHKQRSKDLFLNFWTAPDEQAVRDRETGVYGLWEFGSAARRTQVIIPDLRYCRSEWTKNDAASVQSLAASGFGPYVANSADDVSMLGEEQWQWLEACLRRPARARLLVSSIQFLPEGRGWESWSLFPKEKERLFNLVRDTHSEGLVILSGDTHYGEISRLNGSIAGYTLWEATSSGLTESWPLPGPNPYRVGTAYPQPNFGLLHINWASTPPLIVIEIYAANGQRLRQQSIRLDTLAPSSAQ